MLSTEFQFIWPCGIRGEDFFQKSTNQKQEWPVVAMFVNGSELNEKSLQRTSKNASYQVLIHLAKWFQKSTNQKQEWYVATMFVKRSELNEQSLQRTFQGCFLPSFDSFGQAVSEEKIFQKLTNQKRELPVAAMFVNGSGQNDQSLYRTCHRCFLPSFTSFGCGVSEEKIKMCNRCQVMAKAIVIPIHPVPCNTLFLILFLIHIIYELRHLCK